MEKSYDPKDVERRWYQAWLERGYFTASVNAAGPPYCIVIPPPNITGSLHMGHALNNTIQDILIRWRRMQQYNTLWVPGTDHAGIATQNVVEKQLLQEGTSRERVGRDRFIQRVWEWKAQSGDSIIEQLKRLGASCDWTRLRFTMDEGLSRAVREVFVRLYEEGLIYRGKRLINWCPRCLTALSDIEVEHEETTGRLYYIEYPLSTDPGRKLTVATTRLETMLGDTAVAVHPDDPRYNGLIGKHVKLPLTRREIPIVGDAILVDREFGTGAVKITPAHDFNDFEAGVRHHLPQLSLFDHHAKMDADGLREAQVLDDVYEQVVGRPAQEARNIVVEALRRSGVLTNTEDHAMSIGRCYRCKTIVEPYLSPQWFVNIRPLAAPAIKAVETGQIRLIPEQWINNYLAWMRDIKDWCISRQIWWGHQIPAWYCIHCNEHAIIQTSQKAITILSEAKPLVGLRAPSHCPDCGHHQLVRDPDVLDTWFSSALWPFSTLGWPEDTPDLKKYYPTSTLVTGFDILFFWVARMIMMGLKFMGQIPFKDVYIHALVRDAEGQKMSKSKGNVIDPLTVMDQYGTDALRFTLAAMASPGRDIKLGKERIEGYRNFANKLWNAARFIHMNLEGTRKPTPVAERGIVNRWIMSRTHHCIAQVNSSLERYRFDEAANHLYHFIWHEYCDWYLELAKPALGDKESLLAAHTRATLVESFDILLRLLHPFMPFITEELWQAMPHSGESIMIAPYPSSDRSLLEENVEREIESVQKVVSAVRDIRGVQGIAPSKKLEGAVVVPDQETEGHLEVGRGLIVALAGLARLTIGQTVVPPTHAATGAVVFPGGGVGQVYIDLTGAMDIGKETARLEKRLKELTGQMEQTQKKLSNADFVAKVPPDVLEKTRAKHHEFALEHEKLSTELTRLRQLAGEKP
jgi:valyl-tRNA synthetase